MSPADSSAPSSRPASLRPGPLVVLDEPARHHELYGDAFSELGVAPVCGHGLAADDILALNPAALLLSREWSYEWRLAAGAARRANIPVVYMMDGVLEWSYVWNNLSFVRGEGTVLQPLIASDLCVAGQHPARILAALGLGPRIHVTGLPRYDRFDPTRVVNAAARPRIVVATARTFAHNAEHEVAVRRALRDLKAWFSTRPEIEPVWRIASVLADELGLPAASAGTFSEILSTAAACISFPSTCVLEAMLKGVPVAQVEYRPVPLYVQSAWEIRSAEHIPNVVQELLYPPPPRLAHQRACLRDELAAESSSRALADVLRRALANPAPYDAPAPASSPAPGLLDFRQVHSELSAFAVSDVSVLQYELDAALGLLRNHRKNPPADAARLAQAEALARERLDTVVHLDQVARERQDTIDHLDRLVRAREQTIRELSAALQRFTSPPAAVPRAAVASKPSSVPARA